MEPLSLRPGERVWVDRLRIRDFRSIARLDLEFRYQLTLLIGDNGAGKTTILDALAGVFPGTYPLEPQFSIADVRRVSGRQGAHATLASRQNGNESTATIHAGGVSRPAYLPQMIGNVRAYFGADRSYGDAFGGLVDWFTTKDAEEARQVRDSRSLDYRDPELAEVRRVVETMIPGTSNLRIDPSTGTLVVDQDVAGQSEKFAIAELAGGLRTMLVLVADLARMRVLSRARRPEPPPTLVLIDELDLHLHPRWQTGVARNLLDAFPDAQFIVTTHSEEIISSVPSECVISLQSEEGRVIASPIPPVQGATFDRVLEDAMGLPGRRPPEFQRYFDEYWKLVDAGAGESDEALAIRRKLDGWSQGQEPELVKADLALRRKRPRTSSGT